MKHIKIYIFTLIILTLVILTSTQVQAMSPVLSPGLDKLVSDKQYNNPDSVIEVVIFLDGNELSNEVNSISRGEKIPRGQLIKNVTNTLKSYESINAGIIERFLNNNSSTPVKKHWIVPAFTASLPISRLESLTEFNDMQLVVENAHINFDTPVEEKSAPVMTTSVPQQLNMLNVPSLWQAGFTGKGRLVCSFDTGVEQDHPALSSKWRGNHAVLNACWFSKVNPDQIPVDAVGHGTHTMGVMIGSDGSDTIGVAPDAEWISAGVIDQGRDLNTTISDILDAFEWALNPDGDTSTTDDVPDVILNSWGIPKGLFTPCDETFALAIQNVEAAGVVAIFAAGNEGPNPTTIRNPADMALSPLTSFSVGAVDNTSTIAGFSSRGPSSCDANSIKPEVVAPGVSIYSADKNGGYKLMSGTSMSAPFIAGLVALMREYNPDATVAEIKNALILSAIDLGDPGEDNSYGHGLVDASQLLNYLPAPDGYAFEMVNVRINDDGIASPGEEFDIFLTIGHPRGMTGSIIGKIMTPVSGVSITSAQASFILSSLDSTTTNLLPFSVYISDNFYNGQKINFQLMLTPLSGGLTDTLEFRITIGLEPSGTFATHLTSQIEMTVSDFGQYGLGSGSIYNINGHGYRVNGSENLLYEAGIVMGTDASHMSKSVRGSLGQYAISDFLPVVNLSSDWIGQDNGSHRSATFSDPGLAASVPIEISQETISFPNMDDNGLIIIKYYLKNNSLSDLNEFHFGLLVDFDLGSTPDNVALQNDLDMIYQYNGTDPLAGVVGLKNITGFKAIENKTGKTGFDNSQLFGLISGIPDAIESNTASDWLFMVSTGPLSIAPGDSVEVAIAFVGSYSLEGLLTNANNAKNMYNFATDIDDNLTDNNLPESFYLMQNYPNPFNPTTNIAFNLEMASDVRLEVFNVLGQAVKTLHSGQLSPGVHNFEWDATNDNYDQVSSGVYFYKLSTEFNSQTKKMLLLR